MRLHAWLGVFSLGCGMVSPAPSTTASSPPLSTGSVATPPTAWDQAVAEVDARIDRDTALAATHSTDWTRSERVARLHHERFRLTSDLHDLLAARDHLDEAFRRAPRGGGPHLTAGAIYTTLHDLDRAEAAYEQASQRLLLSHTERAAILRGQAEVALQRGHVDDAADLLERAGTFQSGLLQSCAEARLAEKTEGPGAALAHYREAEALLATDTGVHAAWLQLQLARVTELLEDQHGTVEALEAADEAFPGWFAVDAARGTFLLSRDDRPSGISALKAAAAATPHPEYAARLAVAVAKDDLFEAEALLRVAHETMTAWTDAAPGAMATHAAELALARGESDRALSLASRHAQTHADVDALVLLSRAYLHAGEVGRAEAVFAKVGEGPWADAEVARLCAAGGCPTRDR